MEPCMSFCRHLVSDSYVTRPKYVEMKSFQSKAAEKNETQIV
jgi:hypothetical protein